MKYNPHDYQKYCIQYIIEHPIAAIFLDCGLGKTSITLSAINEMMFNTFEISKVLVIAPLRVATLSWPDEINKFDDFKHLTYSVITGSPKERIAALKKQAKIYIINRDNLKWLIESSAIPFDFDMVVLDELSSFKNHKSLRFKSLMSVRAKITRIVGLTGTPAAKSLEDLFAEFKALDTGVRLFRYITQFRNAFFRPGRTYGMQVFDYVLQPGAEQQIYNKISDITISMKALEHLKMPKLISTNYFVSMSSDEMEKYHKLKKDLILALNDREITAANAAALSGKLCQMANGAIYTDDKTCMEIHQQKLDALEDLIEAANGKPLLVVYWFKHDFERIAERLKALKINYARLQGNQDIHDWNEGKISVGLIQPESAGLGLNLQQGSNQMVWFSLTWNLELYQQTVARLWRQGQKEGTVVVQHLVAKGTIDENILAALERKEKGQNDLLEAVKANILGSVA